VAATLALAATALWSWRRHGSSVSLVLALPLLIALPTLKVEGWVWLIPLALGLILAQLRPMVLGGLVAIPLDLLGSSIVPSVGVDGVHGSRMRCCRGQNDQGLGAETPDLDDGRTVWTTLRGREEPFALLGAHPAVKALNEGRDLSVLLSIGAHEV
jgi:hypothetical protein